MYVVLVIDFYAEGVISWVLAKGEVCSTIPVWDLIVLAKLKTKTAKAQQTADDPPSARRISSRASCENNSIYYNEMESPTYDT
jgi:hypothetical protein